MRARRCRETFPVAVLLQVAIVWASIATFLVVLKFNAITAGDFRHPDDIMRLVQVRDLIAGQGWFDVTQYRVNAPAGGVPMHWSRLVDIPLAVVILILTPIVGMAGAETAAIVIVPLTALLVAMMLCARIALRLAGEGQAVLAAVIMALSFPMMFQFGPMRIDHHGWQIVCALAAANGLMARSDKVGGAVIGIALAVWLSISIEGLALTAVMFAALGLRWLRRSADRTMILSAIGWFAGASIALFAATRGLHDLATHCDAIGPAHLAAFALGAIALGALGRMEPLPTIAVAGGMALTAIGAFAVIASVAPQCATGGGFAALDPLVREYWYPYVLEGMPIWQQEPAVIIIYMITPPLGLFASLQLTSRSHGWRRRFWIDYTLVLAGAIVIALLVTRAGAVATALAAPPLAWKVREWMSAIQTMKRPARRVLASVMLAPAVMPAMLLAFVPDIGSAKDSSDDNGQGAPTQAASTCPMSEMAAQVSHLDRGEIFAPLDISPNLLFSDHRVIATGHHRGHEGMRFVIATSLATPQDAGRALAARGTHYVALCSDLNEARLYETVAPQGFMAALLSGDAPEWLEPLPISSNSGLKVWRVKLEPAV